MGGLTKNISRNELSCNCGCELQTMDFVTINMWQDACDHFATQMNLDKVVLHITSAARCYEYNRLPISRGGPGSNDNSQHPKCCAMDGLIADVPVKYLYDYLDSKYPDKYGIGIYNGFVHADSRETKARWDKRG